MLVKLSDKTFFNPALVVSARGDSDSLYCQLPSGEERYFSGGDAAIVFAGLERESKPVKSPRIGPSGHKYSAAELCPNCHRSLAEDWSDCANHHAAG